MDRAHLDVDRAQSPQVLREKLDAIGTRPRRERLWGVIEELCAIRAWRSAELAPLRGFTQPRMLVQRHLSSMVEVGRLERTRPETPNHPEQGYRVKVERG